MTSDSDGLSDRPSLILSQVVRIEPEMIEIDAAGLVLLAHIEVAQDLAGDLAKGGLVVDGLGQAVEVCPRLGLNIGAHHINKLARALGRRIAGQALSHHQGENIRHGRSGPIVHPRQALALDGRIKNDIKVLAHPGQGVGADSLDPGLFDGLIDG